LTLADAGAKLVLAARDQTRLARVADEVRRKKTVAETVTTDLRQESEIKRMIETTVAKFGGIDLLVNNAGLGYFHPVAEMTTAQWDEMFEVNLRAVFLATREAIPYLRKAGESVVVNVASLAGKNTFPGGAGYTATKWGLRAFAQCLMLEERKHGLRVLTIFPGSVATDFGVTDGRPTKRGNKNITQPEDVADSILHAIMTPQRSMVSEIDIRPSNPQRP